SVQTNFEAIKYSIEQNMEEYDFGGVYHFDTSDGLYTFKYHFCGKDGRKEMLGELDVVYNNDLYTEFIK
ncbi:MAG TPA: peptidoglycan bridge formation glycyltransferase FemA/FemB family protein, partial [Bacteroidales bacterium]|nr:peptidoglycan bridge formation glycyltransferase FemA/FemB family protein [Bacteroidales bacterium]